MDVRVQSPPIVEEAVEDVLRMIDRRGFRVDPDARDALADIVDYGYRQLAESRVLDLPGAERDEALGRARSSLDRFVTRWMAIEASRGYAALTVSGFRATEADVCPVFPFG